MPAASETLTSANETASEHTAEALERTAGEALKLTAGLVPLTTLLITSDNLDAISAQLAQKQQEAPALFNNLPCVLDLAALAQGSSGEQPAIDLSALKQRCLNHGLLPIAVKNCPSCCHTQLQQLKLADLGKGQSKRQQAQHSNTEINKTASVTTSSVNNNSASSNSASSNPVAKLPAAEAKTQRAIKVHSANVRSGQQLYFDGDLIILGMVSAGAEVLASGDVHIYGALRGRALAGVKGDDAAVISCQQFEAELVAIAGDYRLFEEQPEHHQQRVVVMLEQGRLNITSA